MSRWRPHIFAVLTICMSIVFLWNLALVFAPDIFECGDEWPSCSSWEYRKSFLLVVAAPLIWLTAAWALWKTGAGPNVH